MFGFLKLIARIVVAVFYRVRVEGLANFPERGAVVLCANHTFIKDLIIIGSVSPRQIRWMAKIELFRNPVVGRFFRFLGAFPVKRGAHDRESVRIVYSLLGSGAALGIFPEGTRIPGPGVRPPFKRGFVSFAANTGAAILPVALRYEGGPFGRGRLFSRAVLTYGETVALDPGRAYGRGELDAIASSVMSWIHSKLA